jgi:hypothetical protein
MSDGYKQLLNKSVFQDYLSPGLVEHLSGEELPDAVTKFSNVEITNEYGEMKTPEIFNTKPSDVRLPARISGPLIPYPLQIRQMIEGIEPHSKFNVHGHHQSQINSLMTMFNTCKKKGWIVDAPIRFDMDGLKQFARQSYSAREELITLASRSFALRATKHDLSIAAATSVPFEVSPSMISCYTAFIIMVQRLRVHIAKETEICNSNGDFELKTDDEATYTLFDNGVYLYNSMGQARRFSILSCGGHFMIYHGALNYWFSGPSNYLDYVFTLADVLNNLDILKNCKEYLWAAEMIETLILFAQVEGHHNDQVNFMKGIEGFLLNISDYDSQYAMNWKPILEAARDLWELDQKISGVAYDFGLIMTLLDRKAFKAPPQSYLCKMIIQANKLSRTHVQEISALHKMIFYAEVDAQAGVMKFLKRVHTPRVIDKEAVRNITRFAKMHFVISYRKRHNSLPNIIGSPEKIKLLETYCRRGDYSLVESLSLSWWDELRPYNCMDNTLTDDPLEFAKDKGALKSEISFGPGDSRKELLQVIEAKEHKLKDFFAGRTLRAKAKKIINTSQMKDPKKMRDAARLIEKEREQKIEARLFGNAGLENKHSLSLVAAKMKKALSYFDEQLMTPVDRVRKAIIHNASRDLVIPSNYSLLLDIEGHNQSMQYSNTSELCEFVGNLFGFETWGELPNYFSSLTVYHYDEYLDKVIVSEGQLGGIEGWLNPLWTLHTTIMMKLLRVMTDLEVKTIMVYSDDVDAVLSIKQATEPMVKSVFSKIMTHCSKFGMTVKYSQTTLSKHRITILRQHYANGIRADSSLKRLISISAANNAMLVSEELEVAGICSSASSALELSNHNEACSYLKNFKIGLLLARLPQIILSHPRENSILSPEELPSNLSNLLYYSKDDKSALNIATSEELLAASRNDIAAYLKRHPKQMETKLLREVTSRLYSESIAEYRMIDSPDRLLYLQIYDPFLQDLLFFWTYLPCAIGGLGAALHINLILSGHSVGFSKSLHYLVEWINNWSQAPDYFQRYLTVSLSISEEDKENYNEVRLITSTWQNDRIITSATTSVKQAIRSMVRRYTKNEKVIEMFKLSDSHDKLAKEFLEIFRTDFHTRVSQFYHENTSVHFVDLLIGKIETSSGLLTRIRDLLGLRRRLAYRTMENIKRGSSTTRTVYVELRNSNDIIDTLLVRRRKMFPNVNIIEVEEVLYDDKIVEVDMKQALLTVRRCSPMHYKDGVKVYDDPKVGNETLYKGELIDEDRMLGNKEELLAAKLVAVTKWFLMKNNMLHIDKNEKSRLNCVIACNLALSTLTGQTFDELFLYAPTETGGEILHRIPNIRFSTATYIRAEMNRSLNYTTDLNQRMITTMQLTDSNVNFDYMRMRYLVAAILRDKYDNLRRLVVRYAFNRLTGIRDVQFMCPKPITYNVQSEFRPYSEIYGHVMSRMRFRYLSHSFLYEENTNDWALMPLIAEEKSSEILGQEYIDDLIIRYARNLDKDYMLLSPEEIAVNLWKPLIDKLIRIDKSLAGKTEEQMLHFLRERLQTALVKRAKISVADKSNPVLLSLQTQCIESVIESGPSDLEYDLLVKKFSIMMRSRRPQNKLSWRLAKYQALLTQFEEHRRKLARSLIMEYILTFHFKVSIMNYNMRVDVHNSVEEFRGNPIGQWSHVLISPDVQTRMMVLGMSYVEDLAVTDSESIANELSEICDEISLQDVLMPTGLPTLKDHTLLTGLEEIPIEVVGIEYTSIEIPYSAMSTLDEILPLCQYAHKCSTSGASPDTFISLTGSDSLGAQLGLLRHLKDSNVIDDTTQVCDLTAGRGDGLYAMNWLNIKGKSYALGDTFTNLFHHPDIDRTLDYNIFDGKTLKFVTEYDFVHVDVSFTGSTDNNLLDLILFLEENGLSYSIRLNSAICKGYSKDTSAHLPGYTHKIAFSMANHLKPYQIYLVGFPAEGSMNWDGPTLKQTIAFRAIAVSYSRLLSPVNYYDRMPYYRPNSASIYLPEGDDIQGFVRRVCEKSSIEEQRYFSERYISEVGEGQVIKCVPAKMSLSGQQLVRDHFRLFHPGKRLEPIQNPEFAIGNVSSKSYPFHEKHIQSMVHEETSILEIPLHLCTESLLLYFRTHHPLSIIRSSCNIAMGMLRFCSGAFLSGFDAVKQLNRECENELGPKLSLHQKELHMSIKLLVLSANRDDYAYGIHYLHKILATKTRSSKATVRTLRNYRLISYIYPIIKNMLQTGIITIRHLAALEDELVEREMKKYKYDREKSAPESVNFEVFDTNQMIELSMDNLFTGLEKYATDLSEALPETDKDAILADVFKQITTTFDIGIEHQIEAAIARLNLVPSGPHGFIDLGDDDYDEDEDW